MTDESVIPLSGEYEPAATTARRLGVDASRVRRYCEQGRLPGAFKMANRWFVPKNGMPLSRNYGPRPKWEDQ